MTPKTWAYKLQAPSNFEFNIGRKWIAKGVNNSVCGACQQG